jgi:opacity protein-like surface antigen
MRRISFIVAATLALGTATVARAQTPAIGPYAEFQAGFANVSGLLGGEAGYSAPKFDLFFEGGKMFNTKSSTMDDAASTLAAGLQAALGGTVTFEAKQPTNYFNIGFWYKLPVQGRFRPYAGIGLGSAGVTRETKFFKDGTDITGQLAQMGVLLGGDLQGSERGFLFTVGGGARFDLTGLLFGDVSYRYGHVSLSAEGVNTNRIQFGVGAHF